MNDKVHIQDPDGDTLTFSVEKAFDDNNNLTHILYAEHDTNIDGVFVNPEDLRRLSAALLRWASIMEKASGALKTMGETQIILPFPVVDAATGEVIDEPIILVPDTE